MTLAELPPGLSRCLCPRAIYLGFLFARGERPEEVEDALRHAHALLDVRMARERTLSTVVGVQVGCFPDLYSALAANPPDQVVTL